MGVHVGDRGVAESPLCRTGVVRVNGVRYDAITERGSVERGAAVVVVGDDPLGLLVRPVEPGHEADRLPDHGRQVFTSQVERALAADQRREAEVRGDWAAHRRRGTVIGTVIGGLAALVLAVVWDHLVVQAPAEMVAAVAVGVGALTGAGLFQFIDRSLGRFGDEYRRVSITSACVGLAGGAVSAAVCIPLAGLGGGLAVSAAVSLVLAAAIPVLLMACG